MYQTGGLVARRGWWVSDGPWTVRGLFLTWKDAIEGTAGRP